MSTRYSRLVNNGKIIRIPQVSLSKNSTDIYVKYRKNRDRMDSLSSDYYGDSRYWWVIMLANQEYGSMEYEIPDGSTLRIPYPLETALCDYDNKVQSMLETRNVN